MSERGTSSDSEAEYRVKWLWVSEFGRVTWCQLWGLHTPETVPGLDHRKEQTDIRFLSVWSLAEIDEAIAQKVAQSNIPWES